MVKEAKRRISRQDVAAEEAKIQKLMDEREEYRKNLEAMCEDEKKELEDFKLELEFRKKQDKLRADGKLIEMATFKFHFQEDAGGTLPFTFQQIRFSLKCGNEYTYPKYIADHINSLRYPDRELVREPGAKAAVLKTVGWVPRCTATILRTFEKEFDPKTDLPDQNEWRDKATSIHV